MSDEQRPGEYPPLSGNGANGPGSSAEDGFPTQQMPSNTGDSGGQGYPQGQQQQGYGQQYPEGQPPQGYGQQSPPGYVPQGGASGTPVRKSKTPMIIAIIAVVAALILGAIVWAVVSNSEGASPIAVPTETVSDVPSEDPSAEPSEDPPAEPTEEPAAEPTEDPAQPALTPSPNDGQVTLPVEPLETNGQEPPASDLPAMPQRIGEYNALGEPQPELALYATEEGTLPMAVIHVDFLGVNDFISELSNPQEIGDFMCGSEPAENTVTCVAEAYDGIVSVTSEENAEATAAFGAELLAAWK